MRRSEVAPVHGLVGPRAALKGTLAGRALAAVHRRRRAPVAALRAARASGRDRIAGRTPAAGGGPARSVRGFYLLPAGPGSWPALRDTLQSIVHWEGDDVGIAVLDDATVDCRAAVVRRQFPNVRVLRRRWSSGGPPRLFPSLAWAMGQLLRDHDFDVLCKLDTDALVTGPGLIESAARAFSAAPRAGMLGTWGLRADGVPEDYSYDRWALERSERWSSSVRSLARGAREGGYAGEKVHGGVCFYSRAMLDAAEESSLLKWRQPWWSILNDEHCFTLVGFACGFGLASFGGPGEPTVSGQSFLPIDKEDVVREGKLAVHSVRRGARGESERELRDFFRARRVGETAWEAAGGRAGDLAL